MGALPALLYLVLALAALALAGGLLVWVIRYASSRDDGGPKERPQPPTVAMPAPAGEQELLRVSRTEKGELAVFVQGQRRRHLQEIADPQLGRETVEALKAVLAFAEDWLPALRQPPPQPAARKSTVDEETFLERLRRSDMFSLRSPSRSPSKPSPPEPLIPVEKINDLVQERLREQPDLAARYVYLTTGANGSVRIYVGQQIFETVEDIPEPEVRALIQDAVSEWEDSFAGSGEAAWET
jgi:hypothetical protein